MDSIRTGLREGDIEKDTYERLLCSDCKKVLETNLDPDAIGRIRICPECDREWRDID